MAGGGASLDAVETVCRHVEDDTAVESVGLGGLPDAGGKVTLDVAALTDALTALPEADRPAVVAHLAALARLSPAKAASDSDVDTRRLGQHWKVCVLKSSPTSPHPKPPLTGAPARVLVMAIARRSRSRCLKGRL